MIRTTPSRTLQLVAPLLAFGLLLSGCSTGPGEPEVTPPGGGPDASATPEAEVVVGPEECVVGSWKIDNPSFEKFINSAGGPGSGVPAGIDTTVTITGDSYLRFDGKGAYYSWRDDFTLTFGAGAGVSHVSNSAETGEYGVVLGFGGEFKNDFLWVAETMTVMRDEVLTVNGVGQVVDDGGQTMAVNLFEGYRGDVPVVEERESVEGTGPFWCEGDLLTLELENEMKMPLHRSTVRYD